jgi:hypothetical protein
VAYEKGQHPGAVWRKSDLQCHSPRDRNWRGPPSLVGGTEAGESSRNSWANDFIRECVRRDIEIISITDHHDMAFVPYVVEAAKVAFDGTLVFPGVEITCNDNAQCLVLFDPQTDTATWHHFLGKLVGIKQSSSADAKTAPNKNAGMTMQELFDEVTGDPRLRDACVILPHFSDGAAHKHLNEEGHHDRFATLKCDGVYIEKAFTNLDPGTLDKAYGKIPEWGSRRRAFVVTGDNRSLNWERLGAHDCWIKLGENSIEAMRQALLADEARISYEIPTTPSERIVKLTVLSTLTGPEALVVSFNDGFNALIGGRGAGKSAMLEYLRFGLGRTNRDLPGRDDDPFVVDYDRDVQLIEDTLGDDGYVEVQIEREGVTETWHRDLENRDTITVTNEDGESADLAIQDAQRRFRARAFYQKGLSTTMNDTANAAEQITGIAAAEQLDKRREIDASIEKTKREIGTAIRRQSAFWQIRLEHKRAQALVSDLKRRIAAISSKLEKEGLSKETLAVIAQAPLYDRAKNYQGQVNRARVGDAERLSQIKKTLLNVAMSQFPGIDAFSEIKALDDTLAEMRTAITAHLDAAIAEVQKFGLAYAKSLEEFERRDAAFREKLQAAINVQTTHKQLIDEHSRLIAELQKAEQAALEVAEQEEEATDAPTFFEEACTKLDQLISEREKVLGEAAHRVEGQSSQMLKARLKRDPQPEEYVQAITGLMAGARVHDMEEKTRDWVGELVRLNAENSWRSVRRELLGLYEAKIDAGLPPEPSEEDAKTLRTTIFMTSALTPQQTLKVYQNLSDESLANIFAAAPRDYIVMTYVDQGRDVPFEQASPGQQASALLELLLQQSAGTLIIDQPEDDLDNRVIMKIVGLIRTSKSRRQLLFATHNPNIVVNGDADKIVALQSGETKPGQAPVARIQIDVDGAIETPAVRDAITHVMEGGKEAFDLRSRKYNFQTITPQ